MRREKLRIELPTATRALKELLVPSIPLKLTRGSETGRPDDLFLIPHGRPLFIEFKWEAMELEPKQEYWRKILEDLGYDVQTHNNVERALAAIAVEVVAAALHAAGSQVSLGAWGRNPYARSRLTENLHYARSIQFLEEAGRGVKDARDSTVESVLSSVARRVGKMERF
jgi:hypothetical protein